MGFWCSVHKPSRKVWEFLKFPTHCQLWKDVDCTVTRCYNVCINCLHTKPLFLPNYISTPVHQYTQCLVLIPNPREIHYVGHRLQDRNTNKVIYSPIFFLAELCVSSLWSNHSSPYYNEITWDLRHTRAPPSRFTMRIMYHPTIFGLSSWRKISGKGGFWLFCFVYNPLSPVYS